jgi:nicotinamide riboside kinase
VRTIFDFNPIYPHETMRLGFIGSQSVGKSALFKRLATLLRMPAISEGVRHVVGAMGYASPLDVPDKALMQWKVLEFQTHYEDEYGSFISDRSTVDNAAYFDRYMRGKLASREFHSYMNRAKAQAQKYTHLIYCPIMWNGIENDGFRDTDPQERLAIDETVRELIKQFGVSGKVYTLKNDDKVNGDGARLNEVLEHLGLYTLMREMKVGWTMMER